MNSNLITSAASDRGLKPGPPNAGPPLTSKVNQKAEMVMITLILSK